MNSSHINFLVFLSLVSFLILSHPPYFIQLFSALSINFSKVLCIFLYSLEHFYDCSFEFSGSFSTSLSLIFIVAIGICPIFSCFLLLLLLHFHQLEVTIFFYAQRRARDYKKHKYEGEEYGSHNVTLLTFNKTHCHCQLLFFSLTQLISKHLQISLNISFPHIILLWLFY